MPPGDIFWSRDESDFEVWYRPLSTPSEDDSSIGSEDDTEALIEDLADAFSRLTISTPSTSSLSSSTRTSSSSMADLIEEIDLTDSEFEDSSEDEVAVPQEVNGHIVDSRKQNPQDPQPEAALDSQQPISACTDPTPQGRGYQQVASFATFIIIILILRASFSSHYSVPQ